MSRDSYQRLNMSEQNDAWLPYTNIPGVDRYGSRGLQIISPTILQPVERHRSIPSTPNWSHRSLSGKDHLLQSFTNRSRLGSIKSFPQSLSQPFIQQPSGYGRSSQYSMQQMEPLFFGSARSRMHQMAQIPIAGGMAQIGQQQQQCHVKQSRLPTPQQMSTNRSVLRRASSQVSPKSVTRQPREIHSTQANLTSTQSPKHSSSWSPEVSPTSQQPAKNEESGHPQQITSSPASLQLCSPSSPAWVTYRIDKKGTRVPKTTPPPQGTYKVCEGIGRTDYSDPRDLFAPTQKEQRDVWNALQPSRHAFHDHTQINLEINDMRCLDMGYHASWNEIKRKLTQWIFENFSPDRMGSDRYTVPARYLSSEVGGYVAEGVQVIERKQHNPSNTKHFVNGELVVDVDGLLPKLERWYGLIEDFQYSPSWPYERKRNAGGYLVQNPDCFACMHCRENQILCHGFRERADRKCAPCAKTGLACSNEEVILENKLV